MPIKALTIYSAVGFSDMDYSNIKNIKMQEGEIKVTNLFFRIR